MSERTELTKREATGPTLPHLVQAVAPAVDIFENEDEILLHADMPGVQKDDISVDIDNGRLSLSGTRRLETTGAANWEEFGEVEYQRTFSVPQTIDVNKVNAKLKDGVLKLHLPKSEASKARQIDIQ